MTIYAGYAWDGCSPAIKMGPVWAGTPDIRGTFYASCVHDFLCQYRGQHPVSDNDAAELFYSVMVANYGNELLAELYCAAIKLYFRVKGAP